MELEVSRRRVGHPPRPRVTRPVITPRNRSRTTSAHPRLIVTLTIAMVACSNSGGSDYYNTNNPLDDKSPSVVRQQVRDVWNELDGQMRDAICYDVAVLAPAAAISLLQVGGDQLGPGEAEVAYYEYRDLCS